jgi:hypothetical protein
LYLVSLTQRARGVFIVPIDCNAEIILQNFSGFVDDQLGSLALVHALYFETQSDFGSQKNGVQKHTEYN